MAGWLFGGGAESGGCIPSLATVDDDSTSTSKNDRDGTRGQRWNRGRASEQARDAECEKEGEREIRGDEQAVGGGLEAEGGGF